MKANRVESDKDGIIVITTQKVMLYAPGKLGEGEIISERLPKGKMKAHAGRRSSMASPPRLAATC